MKTSRRRSCSREIRTGSLLNPIHFILLLSNISSVTHESLLSVYSRLGHCQDYHLLRVKEGGKKVELTTASYLDDLDEEAIRSYYKSFLKSVGSESAGLEIKNSDLKDLDPFNKQFAEDILRNGYRLAFFIPPRITKTISSLSNQMKGRTVGGSTIHTEGTTFGSSSSRGDNFLFLFATNFKIKDFDKLDPYLNSFYEKYADEGKKDPRIKIKEGIVHCAFSECLKVPSKNNLDTKSLNRKIKEYRDEYGHGVIINKRSLKQAYSLFRTFSEHNYCVFLNGSKDSSPSFAEITIIMDPNKPSGYVKPQN